MSDDQKPRSPKPFAAGKDRKPFAPGSGKPRFGKDGPAKPRTDKPRLDNPRQDTPRQDRPRSDKPGFDKPKFGKPKFDKPKYDKPRPAAPVEARPDEGERIAKRLARAGIASRRDAEAMVEAGRVTVNGRIIEKPGVMVTREDKITVDGVEVAAPERTRLWLFHKPKGTVTTNRDPEGRETIFDRLPTDLPRVITVGRLDINTEGLLLLTNDGGLGRVLELPETGWLRRYRARVHGTVDETALNDIRQGAVVDGVFYGPIEVKVERVQGSNTWVDVGLREGKNREVKNVLGSLGLEVTRLIRVSFGPFTLGDLEPGAVQEIRGRILRDQLGDRLIEQAGCDFESEIKTPFPNRPVVKGEQTHTPSRFSGKTKYAEPTPLPGVAEDGTKKNRRPGRGVHVWMASGARPRSPKEIEEAKEEGRARARAAGGARKDGQPFKSRGFKDHASSESGKPASKSRGFKRHDDQGGERGEARPARAASGAESRPAGFKDETRKPGGFKQGGFKQGGRGPGGKPGMNNGGKPGMKSGAKPGMGRGGKPGGNPGGKPGGGRGADRRR